MVLKESWKVLYVICRRKVGQSQSLTFLFNMWHMGVKQSEGEGNKRGSKDHFSVYTCIQLNSSFGLQFTRLPKSELQLPPLLIHFICRMIQFKVL